ncbi:MAG: PAS domain-containing protein [Rhodoferax sp.]|nr:PAS domain-containing protein [Rhodoferax sp.]
MRLLLLEDDEMLGEGLRDYLGADGHVVDWCRSLGDTQALRGEPFDALLVDWQLPDGSGLDWLRARRARGDRTPALMLTARDRLVQRIEGLDAGADDYVTKPVDEDLLRVRIAVLERLVASREERLRAEAQLRRRYTDLLAVHGLTAAASRPSPLEDVYEDVLDALEQAFHTRRAAILLERPGGALEFAAWHGLSEAFRARAAVSPRRPGSTDPILIDSVDSDPSLADVDALHRGEGIRAVAYLPLLYDDRVLGEMVLYHGAPHQFTEEEVRLAMTMAAHVAFAIGRRQSEDALRFSEERFRQLAEHIEDIFWMSAAQHSEMVYVSPAFERICGRPREQLYRDPGSFLDLVHPNDLVIVEEALSELKSGRFPDLECRILRPDGTVRWIRTRIFPIPDTSGTRVVRFAGISRDATEEKLGAEQLLQSEKLAATGMFVSGIAHELNNPLTAVLGFSELLNRQSETLTPRTARWAEQIHAQALRAKSIVEKLLTFSRHHKPDVGPADVNEVVGRALNAFADECHARAIKVEFEPGQVPPVLVDERQIRQVLLHLFSNAVQAMASAHGGGLLRVTTQPADGDRVSVRVADDGPGIGREESRRIFDPFFTTKEVGEGLGLGLSTAFAIVEEHGGELQLVETQPPPGATFVLLLPVANVESPVAAATRS